MAGTQITDVAASGADHLDDNSRLFFIDGAEAHTTFESLILTGGRNFYRGGAIWSSFADVTLTNSTLSGNSTVGLGQVGGGISSREGAVTLTNSTLSGNSTVGDFAHGGGVYSQRGAVTLTNSTLSGNSTAGGTAFGGAITSFSGDVTLTNSTLSGNSTAGNNARGGGVYAVFGDVTLTNSLFLGNISAQTDDDEIGLGAVTGIGSIEFGGPNSLVLQGGNIVGDEFTIDGASPTTVTAAMVFAATQTLTVGGVSTEAGVLADNGGPVRTIALLADAANPALDASGPGATPADARGEAAVDQPGIGGSGAGARDLGAYELTRVLETPSLVVTTAEDIVDPFDGETSLREAVALANATPGADTITFASGAGAAFAGDAVIRLTQGEIEITDALTIDGSTAGAAVVITGDRDGDDVRVAGTQITDVAASGAGLLDDNSRLFDITGAGAHTTLVGLTLTGGRTTGSNDGGGGIRIGDADLTLRDSTLSGNSTAGSNGDGGGIHSGSGDVTLRNTTLSGNSTASTFAEGGGIFSRGGAVTLENSTLSGRMFHRRAIRAFGGALPFIKCRAR